jgi:hypothetical protein
LSAGDAALEAQTRAQLRALLGVAADFIHDAYGLIDDVNKVTPDDGALGSLSFLGKLSSPVLAPIALAGAGLKMQLSTTRSDLDTLNARAMDLYSSIPDDDTTPDFYSVGQVGAILNEAEGYFQGLTSIDQSFPVRFAETAQAAVQTGVKGAVDKTVAAAKNIVTNAAMGLTWAVALALLAFVLIFVLKVGSTRRAAAA